jgi:hypothetical protein
MLHEGALAEALAGLGYKCVQPFVYKAFSAGGLIQHYLYFTVWGTGNEFLSGDFGFRECQAQNFGIECVRLYGGAVYGALQYDPEVDCSMTYSLGKLAAWGPRSSFNLAETPIETIVARVTSSVQKWVVPLIRELDDESKLLSVLVHDSEPCRWVYINGAIRAAQIIFLASRQMIAWDKIELSLAPFKKEIWANLGKGKNPDGFLSDVRAHFLEMVDRPEAKPARTLQ